MIISIGSDHRGFEVKTKIIKKLNEKGLKTIDKGTNTKESVDYPQYAKMVGLSVANGESDLGIVLCKTGIGVSIACNKVSGVRCARITRKNDAKLAREHNDANVLALSADEPEKIVFEIIYEFINTKFSKESRHIKRIGMLEGND